MSSWIYLISKFTPEMLLLESVAILTLLGSYAAFWVLKKRKHGAIQDDVPAGVVKDYLNELIRDAGQLRSTLFGILSAAGMQVPADGAIDGIVGAGVSADPSLLKKIGELETRMLSQARATEGIVLEKARIEKELAEARAAGLALGASGEKVDTSLIDELKRKIALLESKLAEYSVIEDDLANLKKLQQENAQLKAALGDRQLPGPNEPAVLVTAAANAVAAETKPAPAPIPASAPVAAAAKDQLADVPAAEAFEGLVDQVEQSLQEAPATEAAVAAEAAKLLEGEPTAAKPAEKPAVAAAAPAPAEAAPAPTAAASAGAQDGDADLVAEFEKMLNG